MNLTELRLLVQDELFDEFDCRNDELHWREGGDGSLFVGDGLRPTTVVEVTEGSDGLSTSLNNPHTAEWDRLDVVSQPDSVTARQ